MENPNFEGSSSFQLPDLGTAKKGSANKDSVKYVKSINDIVSKPVVNLGNAEKGQVSDKKLQPVLKKHIMAKKWYKMEMSLILVIFVIILGFFIAAMALIHYSNNGLKEDLKKEFYAEVPKMLKKMKEQLKKELPAIKKTFREVMKDEMPAIMKEMKKVMAQELLKD